MSFLKYTCSLVQMRQGHLLEEEFQKGNHPRDPGHPVVGTIVLLLSRDWSKHSCVSTHSRGLLLPLHASILDSPPLHLFSTSSTELRAPTLINPSPTYTFVYPIVFFRAKISILDRCRLADTKHSFGEMKNAIENVIEVKH